MVLAAAGGACASCRRRGSCGELYRGGDAATLRTRQARAGGHGVACGCHRAGGRGYAGGHRAGAAGAQRARGYAGGSSAWSTGARATSWSRLEYPDNLKFLVQEISGLKIKIRTEFLAIFCILNTFFRQARTARHRTAAGPRGHGGPDGDIPTALMPRTLGTVSSSTLVGNSDKWCVGRARPRVARSASRRVSI